VGPMKRDVEELRKKHDAWLKKFKKEWKNPAEALAAYVDTSVPNLFSLVLLASIAGKRILLTGDARGDQVLRNLEAAGLMKKGGKIEVDLLKVPPRGSSDNLADDFFERIIAKHYVFSGNGEHGNPEREALEMLFNARSDDDYTIHLTYPIDEIDEGRKQNWKKEQNKEKDKKKKNPKQKVRPDWSPAKNGLRAFFDKHGLEDKIRIVDPQEPYLIDFLEPVKF
jgi:hypothetical protein